jgi:hypothetical protein
MDMTISLIAAAAVVTAGLSLLYIVLSQSCFPTPVPKASPHLATVNCAPDGIAITSLDRLRAAVTSLDRMINTGRAPDGRRSTMIQTGATADAFAQQQISPDVTLAQLSRCDDSLIAVYPHGYWMLSSALVRESARRRTVQQPLVTPRAP